MGAILKPAVADFLAERITILKLLPDSYGRIRRVPVFQQLLQRQMLTVLERGQKRQDCRSLLRYHR